MKISTSHIFAKLDALNLFVFDDPSPAELNSILMIINEF